MKASELIEVLQQLIKDYGDQPVAEIIDYDQEDVLVTCISTAYYVGKEDMDTYEDHPYKPEGSCFLIS